MSEHGTWLQSEKFAYPRGGQTRKGKAIFPDGKLRTVHAGIPDTFFSIPAHGRLNGRYVAGFLMIDDRSVECPVCHGHWYEPERCENCYFGLVDSPTRGAWIFHIYKRYAEVLAA